MSAENYKLVYDSHKQYYHGINAATLALLSGAEAQAKAIAEEVKDLCLLEIETNGEDYWVLATLGEVWLILDKMDNAAVWYGKAFEKGRGRWADIQSTRRQAQRILAYRDLDTQWIDEYLPIPQVIMFVGHMIDQENQRKPRFPSHIEEGVSSVMASRIEDLSRLGGREEHFSYGYASCANGGDILFHEALTAQGGESHVVLPYQEEQFVEDSVDIVDPAGGGPRWGDRCKRVMIRAAEVVRTSEGKLIGGTESYEYANLILHGLARMKASELDTELIGLLLWDCESGDGAGGTASNFKSWINAKAPSTNKLSTSRPWRCPSGKARGARIH